MKRSAVFLMVPIIAFIMNACDKKNPVNFSKKSCTISGIITQDSTPLAGVLVSFSDDSSLITDKSGTYSKTVKCKSDLTITPRKDGYLFDPASKIFTNLLNDQIQNFSAEPNYRIIRGNVSAGGSPLENVLITFSDGSTKTTNRSGEYSKLLFYGSSVVIKPGKAGYTFEPDSLQIVDVREDKPGQDFIGFKIGLCMDDLVGTYRLDHWRSCGESLPQTCYSDTAYGCMPFGKMTISNHGEVNQIYDYCINNTMDGGQRQSNFWIDSTTKENGNLTIIFGPLRGGVEPVARGSLNAEMLIIRQIENFTSITYTWTRTSRMVEKAKISIK